MVEGSFLGKFELELGLLLSQSIQSVKSGEKMAKWRMVMVTHILSLLTIHVCNQFQ